MLCFKIEDYVGYLLLELCVLSLVWNSRAVTPAKLHPGWLTRSSLLLVPCVFSEQFCLMPPIFVIRTAFFVNERRFLSPRPHTHVPCDATAVVPLTRLPGRQLLPQREGNCCTPSERPRGSERTAWIYCLMANSENRNLSCSQDLTTSP